MTSASTFADHIWSHPTPHLSLHSIITQIQLDARSDFEFEVPIGNKPFPLQQQTAVQTKTPMKETNSNESAN